MCAGASSATHLLSNAIEWTIYRRSVVQSVVGIKCHIIDINYALGITWKPSHNIYQLRIHTRSLYFNKRNSNKCLTAVWSNQHTLTDMHTLTHEHYIRTQSQFHIHTREYAYVNIWTLSIIMQKRSLFFFHFNVRLLPWWCVLCCCCCCCVCVFLFRIL